MGFSWRFSLKPLHWIYGNPPSDYDVRISIARLCRLAKAAAPWEEAMVTLERKTFDLDIPTWRDGAVGWWEDGINGWVSENLHRKPWFFTWFLPETIGVSGQFSHDPILWLDDWMMKGWKLRIASILSGRQIWQRKTSTTTQIYTYIIIYLDINNYDQWDL